MYSMRRNVTQQSIYVIFAGFVLLFMHSAYAKRMFILPNETSYITISKPSLSEVPASGPSDFVVLNEHVVILDSDNHAISYFSLTGKLIKRLVLPKGYYQRLIKDRDGTLFAFANQGLGTKVVKISNTVQEKEIHANLDNLISHLVVDDFGVFFEAQNRLNLNVLNEHSHGFVHIKQRIDRLCFSCDPQRANDPMINGKRYRIDYEGKNGEKPILLIDKQRVALIYDAKNAGTRIEQIDKDGTAWVKQSIFTRQDTVETYVLQISPTGVLDSLYKLPKVSVSDYVMHSVSISDKHEVWMMRGLDQGLAFDVVPALTKEQSSHLFAALSFKKTVPGLLPTTSSFTPVSSEPCQPRAKMFSRALQYLYHHQCFLNGAIENDSSCVGRHIPPYLVGNASACLDSVSYSWGGFDSVDAFREKVLHIKAGNVNTAISPLPACTAGVDCSGFVSVLWGLKTKWNTEQIFKNTLGVLIDKMKTGDVFVKPNNHVLFYASRKNDELTTFESTVRPGKVIQSQHEVGWFVQHGYLPRVAFNACEK